MRGVDSGRHLQNVWHYALEFGCYSYSPAHFASAFKVLVIEPIKYKFYDPESMDEHQEYEYAVYYALHRKRDRPPVQLPLPEDMHVHEWFKDVVFHDPMEQFGSYADGKGKVSLAFLSPENDCMEVECSIPLDEWEGSPSAFKKQKTRDVGNA